MADQQTSEPNELADLVGPFWAQPKVCSSLLVTPGALADLTAVGGLLALDSTDGVTFYPVWQFHRRDDVVEVKPDLLPAFQALRGFDGWTVAVLLHTPAPELDDTTPLAWLRAGRAPAAVADLAEVVAHEWRAGAA